MTTDHTNDKTPEAPPAREPGWYWAKLLDFDDEWLPVDYCWEELRKRWMVADGSSFYELNEVSQWGPRIDPPGQPTEPPPLPGGWTMERSVHGAIPEDIPCTCYDGFEGDYVVVMDDGRVHADAMVGDLLHLLGLTAPAADVRALTRIADRLEAMAAAGGDVNLDDGGPGMLALAAQLHGLTGKGAPL